jgi:hypothetical protein
VKGTVWKKLGLMIPNLAESIKRLVERELDEDFVDLSI